jgi:hypothetical protein
MKLVKARYFMGVITRNCVMTTINITPTKNYLFMKKNSVSLLVHFHYDVCFPGINKMFAHVILWFRLL